MSYHLILFFYENNRHTSKTLQERFQTKGEAKKRKAEIEKDGYKGFHPRSIDIVPGPPTKVSGISSPYDEE